MIEHAILALFVEKTRLLGAEIGGDDGFTPPAVRTLSDSMVLELLL